MTASVPKKGVLAELYKQDLHHDKEGGLISKNRTGKPDKRATQELAAIEQHSLVLESHYNHERGLEHQELVINNSHILEILAKVVKYHPEISSFQSPGTRIRSPFKPLYWHWDELKEHASSEELEDEKLMQLNLLLKVLEETCGSDHIATQLQVTTGYINFAFLWSIFEYGSLVYAPKTDQLWRVKDTLYDEDNKGRYLLLTLLRTNYNEEIGREEGWKIIREGELGPNMTQITRLQMFPIKFMEQHKREALVDRMITRGKRSLELGFNPARVSTMRYDGCLQMLKPPPKSYYSDERDDYYVGKYIPQMFQGRIILHANGFYADNYSFTPDLEETTDEPLAKKPPYCAHTEAFWPADDPMLLSAYVYGFCPALKLWCKFNVDKVLDPEWIDDAFDRLVLPSEPKEVIESLVVEHEWPVVNSGAVDQQMSKGKGLVILLHGAPGTGKTMTAETVAETVKSALIVVSSGELGSNVTEVNESLEHFFELAAIWKAVILIDEADVFLEKRISSGGGGNRLEANSLVALFLRHLEYFQGIVFLTSNREKGFDPAIKSRIHLSLKFSPPDIKTRRTLWRQALERVPADARSFDTDEVLSIVENLEVNGREISNGVQTMRTLARRKKQPLSKEQFLVFTKVWDNFEDVEEEGKGRIGPDGKLMRKYVSADEPCVACGCDCKVTQEPALRLLSRRTMEF